MAEIPAAVSMKLRAVLATEDTTSNICEKTETSLPEATEEISTLITSKSNTLQSTQGKQSSSEQMATPRALQPSTAYLAIARSPSSRVTPPQRPRKLLVLDLNGTLLLRPKPRNKDRRPVHPRPYMSSFRSYLFHETVKTWLDVMVWSSAQPQSVDGMVRRCFEDHRSELKAIWARDMLGLEASQYFKKVQTVKDLQKCWSVLSDSIPSHTAETTLLIDDSVGKALLQPHNHLCVSEYTQNLRNRDLLTQARLAIAEKKGKQANQMRKRRRLDPHLVFDPTLLAVIGVLEEIKEETNVAGWIHAGGLWGGKGRPPAPSPFELFSDKEQDGKKGDHLSAAANRPSKRRRLKLHEKEGSPSSNPGNDITSDQDDVMWFDHQPCFEHWVGRGTRAVEALGITLDHGFRR